MAVSWLAWTLRFLKNSVWDYNAHPLFEITGLQGWKAKGKQIITRQAGVWVCAYVLREEQSSRKAFAKQNNFNICFSAEKGNKFCLNKGN